MKNKSRLSHSFHLSYQDMLWNIIIFFSMMFMLAIVQLSTKIKEKDNDVKEEAQYLIVMSWPDTYASDIDLWVQTPTSEKVGFHNTGTNVVSLERDDQGLINDKTYTETGVETPVYLNREVTRIRAKLDGKYVVNVQFYGRYKDPFTGVADPEQIPVTVELQKIHPKYEVIERTTVTVSKVGDEVTAFSFYLNKGEPNTISKGINIPFVTKNSETVVQ